MEIGMSVKKLAEAVNNKLTIPHTLRVLTAFWGKKDVIIVGPLGRACMILLISEQDGLETRPRLAPALTGVPEIMAVLLPRPDQEVPDPYEFWSPDRVMPEIRAVMDSRTADLRQDTFWSSRPTGAFEKIYRGGNIEISLINVLYTSTGEVIFNLHRLLQDEIDKEKAAT